VSLLAHTKNNNHSAGGDSQEESSQVKPAMAKPGTRTMGPCGTPERSGTMIRKGGLANALSSFPVAEVRALSILGNSLNKESDCLIQGSLKTV